jgi:hypothetical protein
MNKQQQQHALVLLGVRNSGKDTLAKLFVEKAAPGSVRICKFCELTKSLVAAAFAVPVSDLENKELRTLPLNPALMGDLSLLDLLDALFFATELPKPSCKRLAEANRIFCRELAKRAEAELLIFTDIRREEEAKVVLQTFPYTAVHLHRSGCKPAPTDSYIQDASNLLEAQHLSIRASETPQETYARLQALLLKET